MMTPYERLADMVLHDPRFVDTVNNTFWAVRHHGRNPSHAYLQMTDTLCVRHGLSGEIRQSGIVLWVATSRAKQPACVVISLDAGQPNSPSSIVVRRTGLAMIQVFEGDADDRDVAEFSARPTHWIEAQGRVLIH